MKFSIITATYNSEKYLPLTLKSILNLEANDFEYIIVDGASNDKTIEIIESYIPKFKEKNIPFQYISEPDKGIYDAWNKGISMAQGEWISFLGSDDEYLPNALSLYSQAIAKGLYNYVSSKIILLNEEENTSIEVSEKFNKKKLLFEMSHAHVGSFTKADLLRKNPFSTEYSIVGDYHFFLQNRNKINAAFVPQVTAIMRVGGVSSSNVKKVLAQNKRLRNDLKIFPNFINEIWYWIEWLKYNIRKRVKGY